MATVEQIEAGIANYLDREVFANYQENTIVKAMMQAGIGFTIHRRKNEAIQALKMMGAMDENGDVDVKSLAEFLKKYIPESGSYFQNNMIGRLTFQKEDVDKLYNYIVNVGGTTTV